MNDNRISICLTNYNRTSMLLQSFSQVLDHELVSEIIIADDCSNQGVIDELISWQFPKVRVALNSQNLGCYANKRRAVSLAANDWVILFDSDNILTKEYLDRIENLMIAGVNAKTLYQPEFARPHFDFTQFSGTNFARGNIGRNAENSTFCTMLNAMNYFVNKDEYLRVWENRPEPWTADSLLQNYNWLNAGNSIYVVPGLTYEHRVHEGSHYKEHVHKTGNLYNEIVHKLRLL